MVVMITFQRMCESQPYVCPSKLNTLNTLRPSQTGRKFPNSIFQCIFLNLDIPISSIGSDSWLAPARRQAIISTNDS